VFASGLETKGEGGLFWGDWRLLLWFWEWRGFRGRRRLHLSRFILPPPPPDDMRSAETDAKLHQLVAALVERHDRESAQRDVPEPDDYLWQLSQERDRAALILVRGGDRIYRECHDRPAAEADYRQAIRLFPKSPAAAVAQQRLRNIDEKGNES
jgi:hypothetical protein